ncbi:nuclear transport factor 2 family protein [bacterium]|nr:nuclear transport factor 2 family protein [bacterium]
MTLREAENFARDWIEAWNSHDIEAVLAHYTDDFEMSSPMIQAALGVASGTLKGKQAVGDYWRTALKRAPDLRFSVLDVTCGVDSVSIYYKAVLGKKAIETFFFDGSGKVFKASATYN